MSLTQAINSSMSGLRATQAGLSLVSSNVSNAQTPGYVRRSLLLDTVTLGDTSGGVLVRGVQRELDLFVLNQLRVETSGGAYADVRAQFLQRLQQAFGEPGSASAIETMFNKFTSDVQALVTNPESTAARSVVLNSAQTLAQSLNNLTSVIQSLRSEAENALASAVETANNAIQKISAINMQLTGAKAGGVAEAGLMDERDRYIDQLSQLMDIRVVTTTLGQVDVMTTSGVQLVGAGTGALSFTAQGTVTAAAQWDPDPDVSGLGTLSIAAGGNDSVDLISSNSIRSGKIAALIDMRDNVLVQAQAQLDALAAALAQALSTESVDSTAATVGAQTGFDIDTAGLLPGNSVSLTYTDNFTNTQHQVKIIWVDEAGALPLDNSATADPDDEVFGVDISGGLASIVSQLNVQFGSRLQFSNSSGTTLRVLDDGVVGLSDVDALSAERTATLINGNDPALAFFTDGNSPYSGEISSVGSQSVGFAGRITVNRLLMADASKLVLFGANSAVGNPERPQFIYDQLTAAQFAFSADTGFGTAAAPFTSNFPTFLRQILSMQGEAAANAASLAQGQEVVVNALKQRMAESSGVNVDQEMAQLISLQSAYGANARVISAVKDMIDMLLSM